MRTAAVRRISQLNRSRLSALASRCSGVTAKASENDAQRPALSPWIYQQSRTRCFKHLVTPNEDPSPSSNISNSITQHHRQQQRQFQSEATFHEVADETLEAIQDTVEELFEDNLADSSEMPEINVASGVLTLSMPPHGTWVLNKQTPNRQIWWSSPLSGPRRYEYCDDDEVWLYTRYVDTRDSGKEYDEEEYRDSKTLGGALSSEIKTLYGLDVELDL